MNGSKHENYEILNLLGYGLAKFDSAFIEHFGVASKTAFYEKLVGAGIAETASTIKNRQDLFDPFFENGRKGWWQKGDAYIHRKDFIDSLFGDLDAEQFAMIVKAYLSEQFSVNSEQVKVSPILKSRFRQLQETGIEAELYFKNCFQKIKKFEKGVLEDGRLFGDGYDFQITVNDTCYLAEIKGVREQSGAIRLTEKEYAQALVYQEDYTLVVVSNLNDQPKLTPIFDPIKELQLKPIVFSSEQIQFHSPVIKW
jgi:hypothetical protein